MNFLKKEIISINAAALLIGAAGLLSRILGLFRDRFLAAEFGASRELDIYYAAFQIPDFVFTVFLVGSATAAIIPVFLEFWERDKKEAERLIEGLFTIFLFASAIFCSALFFAIPFFVRLLTPGFSYDDQQMTVLLARIMLVSPFFLSLSNIVSGVIQAHRRFVTFALAPIFYNVGIIFGIVVLYPLMGFQGLALGVASGALLHFLVQVPAYRGMGFSFRLAFAWHPGMAMIVALSFPRVLAIASVSVSALIINAVASTLTPGSITVFQFAKNIEFIPVGILGVSFAVAAFPRLSAAFVKKNAYDFYAAFFGTLRIIVFWLAPISVLFFVLRAHIVRLALGAGLFDWRDTRLTAAVLGAFSFLIIVESIMPLVVKSFYALNKTARPLIINIGSALLTIALAFFLSRVFSDPTGYFPGVLGRVLRVEDIRELGVLGIAVAIVIGQMVNFVVLCKFFVSELKSSFGELPKNGFFGALILMGCTSVVAGAVTYGMLRLIHMAVSLDSFVGVLIQGGGAGLAGAFTYAVLLWVFGNKEVRDVVEVFRRRMFSIASLPRELDGGQRY